MPVLELKNIKKSYFLGKDEFPVLKGINLEFERGDFVSLLGESGGGKSTLMNIIGGLDRKYEGDVLVDGIAQKTKKEKDMDAYRRDTIGFIFQSFNLVSYLSVLDNILVSLKMTALSEKERHARAIELTKQVGLYEHRKKKPAQLSGGQKQRVAIARALASDPEIILADEPTGALDSQNTKEVLAILRDIAQSGKTVIVVTHSQEVADYGTRIIHLADGVITGDERLKAPYPAEPHTRVNSKALSFGDTFKTAFKHFTNAWKINLLIAIGTAIGLFSVIFFLGLGNGGTKYMNDQVTSIANPNVVAVVKRGPNNTTKNNQEAWSNANQNMAQNADDFKLTSSTMSQLKAIDNVKDIQSMYVIGTPTTVKLGENSGHISQIQSWTALFQESSLDAGKKPGKNEIVLQESDVRSLDQKAFENKDWKSMIGKTVDATFTLTTSTGPKQVTQSLKISGIMQSVPGMGAAMSSDTMKSLFEANDYSTDPFFAVITANNSKNVKQVTKDIENIKSDGKKVFATNGVGSILDTINNITGIVTTVLASVAGISLVVSIFMIVVTTYMSVAERTKEIGIIRAMGGRKKDISRLFTAESLILGLSSAILAIALAFIGQSVINAALHSLVGGNIVAITPYHIIATVIIAVVIALVASLAPSGRAARLNTIEALATE
ncbi:MAG: ATP-binding cassette domain-containing protein [Streptococcaceae bacterium]|nr:ATP-binding cassette domain-containing protein [Streptococcaceae bacterium]